MQKICWFFGIWFLSWGSAIAQSPVDAIAGLMDDQEFAWNRGDIEGFMQHYWPDDSLVFVGSDGIHFGWNNLMSRYQKSYPNQSAMGQLKFEILHAKKLSENVVLVIGEWHLKADEKEQGGMFSLSWKQFPEGWKIAADHTSLFH